MQFYYLWQLVKFMQKVCGFFSPMTNSRFQLQQLQLSCTPCNPLNISVIILAQPLHECLKTHLETEYNRCKEKKDVFSVQSGNDGDAGIPAPQHTARLPTYLWHTAAALRLFLVLLTGKVTIVHTPVLQQRVEDSAK